jgi:hypothetical protein
VLLTSLREVADGDRLSATSPQLTVSRTIQDAWLLHRQRECPEIGGIGTESI